MSWIRTIAYGEANNRLRTLYDRVKGPGEQVDNIMMLHSLRPHTLEGHMAIYKQVLHHSGNTLPKWLLETIGVWVSMLNRCDYCVEHHFAGLARLLGDERRAQAIRAALDAGDLGRAPLTPAQRLALEYARTLTLAPHEIDEARIQELRLADYDDGQILEINQVAAYFGYANRTVLGLGGSIEGDILGLSPNNADDPADWSHS